MGINFSQITMDRKVRKFKDLTQQEKVEWYKEMIPILTFNSMTLEYPKEGKTKELKKMQQLWIKIMTKYNLI